MRVPVATMHLLPNLLKSLLLTSIFAFLAPVLLLGSIAMLFIAAEHVPGLQPLGQVAIAQLNHFLCIFGSGNSLRGVMVIGMVCSLVGMLFDSYTFYRHQNLGMRDEG